MNKLTIWIVLLSLYSCLQKDHSEKKKHSIVSLYYINSDYAPIFFEFFDNNSMTVHLSDNPLDSGRHFNIERSQRLKLDSFIRAMSDNKRNENYPLKENETGIAEEYHHYSIEIYNDSLRKQVSIYGHRAPLKFYVFMAWVTTLWAKLEK